MGHGREIPDATVARLPLYYRILTDLRQRAISTVSSDGLAEAAGVSAAMLRKDLSHLGSLGTRGVGYDVDYVRFQVAKELGVAQTTPILIVGAGNLGRALAGYRGFDSRGFQVVALLDDNPLLVTESQDPITAAQTATYGRSELPIPIGDARDLEAVAAAHPGAIGVIATPAEQAQLVADRLIGAGVVSILNFAPVVLAVKESVEVRQVDLASELQILAFHQQRIAGIGESTRDQVEGLDTGRRSVVAVTGGLAS